MITGPISQETLAYWQNLHQRFSGKFLPNKKSGTEVLTYLQSKYSLQPLPGNELLSAVTDNILFNDFHREKLPTDTMPDPVAFVLKKEGSGNRFYESQDAIYENCPILIGIDLTTGYVQVEGSNQLYDEILAFQGLDAFDIQNYVVFGEYLECVKRLNPNIYNSICD